MANNDSILIEIQPFPLIIWTKYLFSKKHIILLSCESYHKMTFRNRFVLSGSNGLIHLSVPLIHGRDQKIPFKDVQICYGEKWQLIHWRTITSCYNKSPWFEYYRDELEKFFINKWEFLFDWNLVIMSWLKQVLQFPAELVVTAQLPEAGWRRRHAGCLRHVRGMHAHRPRRASGRHRRRARRQRPRGHRRSRSYRV